eukprot:TRINITY_DN5951_c0_g1_i1.p1 TRINITY_DN5951_c0_g1~~TRINITY_DN5951_c0_g1_i1.p1  ORF type:complete len:328 (+),score=79.38 TRINITY_DN5951_c0_g1_i1:75-1058(+)
MVMKAFAFVRMATSLMACGIAVSMASRVPRQRGGLRGGGLPCDGHVPCPCLTTPQPLVDQAEAEQSQVRDAVQEAVTHASAEIRAAAVEAARSPSETIEDTVVEKNVAANILPVLQRLGQEDVNNTRMSLEGKYELHKAFETQLMTSSNHYFQANLAELVSGAKEFAASSMRNMVAFGTAPGLSETWAEEAKAQQYQQAASELAQAAISTANRTLALAVEAQRSAELMPRERMDKAKAFAQQMVDESEILQHQADRAAYLSRLARATAEEAAANSDRALQRAKAAETKAAQALSQAQANAATLSQLYNEAQAAEMSATRTAASAARS